MGLKSDEYAVCVDCYMFAANGDLSALALNPETEDDRRTAITEGFERLGGYAVASGPEGFSWHECECCRDGLGGDRYVVTIHHWTKRKDTFTSNAK